MKNKIHAKTNSGFSLIELIIVVAITSLLIAIGIPQYSKFKAKAHDTQAKISLGALFVSERSFYSQYGFYHTSLEAIGFGVEGKQYFNVGFGTPTALIASGFGFVAPVDVNQISLKQQCVGANGTGTNAACVFIVNVPDLIPTATTLQTEFFASAMSYPGLYASTDATSGSSATAVASAFFSPNAANAVGSDTGFNCGVASWAARFPAICASPDEWSEDTSVRMWTIDHNKQLVQVPYMVNILSL